MGRRLHACQTRQEGAQTGAGCRDPCQHKCLDHERGLAVSELSYCLPQV